MGYMGPDVAPSTRVFTYGPMCLISSQTHTCFQWSFIYELLSQDLRDIDVWSRDLIAILRSK